MIKQDLNMSVIFAVIFILFLNLAEKKTFIEATPAPLQMTCQDQICSLEGERFYCPKRRLVCCPGPNEGVNQIFAMEDGYRCCQGTGKMYNFLNEICVDGKIRRRNPSEENCGRYAYDVTNQVCCDGVIFEKSPGGECCSGEYLLDSNESCCQGQKYNKSEKVCCPQAHNDPNRSKFLLFDIPYGKCCLDTPFDPLVQSCQFKHGTYSLIEQASQNLKYCGRVHPRAYDPLTHGCCFSSKPEVYEIRTHICARGRIFRKSDWRQNDVCFHRYDNRIIGIPYFRTKNIICVGGRIVHLGPMEDACGSHIYNTSTDLCCGSRLHKGSKLSGHVCCNAGMGTNIFNPDKQVCCMNEVINTYSYNSGGRCCVKTPYNSETHRCDRGVIKTTKCPDASECAVTMSKIRRLREKSFVYIGTIASTNTSSTRKRMLQWTLKDVAFFKSKRGKMSVIPVCIEGLVVLKAKKCDCTDNMIINSRYIFVIRKPVRSRRPFINFKGTNGDIIVPLDRVNELGILLKGLSENS